MARTATLNTPLKKRPISGGASALHPLRAIIDKELHQHRITLALALFTEVIIVCICEWFRTGFLTSGADRYINVLLYPSVRDAIPVACAAAALTIGIAQPLADLNFDRWAFLIHRPLSRSRLFLGRAAAGLILYALAAGVPLLMLFVFANTRYGGYYFIKQYTYPPIADFITGVTFYFAGLLLCERQARYYGSRIAPIIVSLAAFACAQILPSFALALLVEGFFVALLFFAAMGSFVSHGYTLRAPRLPRLALRFALLLAFSLLLGVPATLARWSIENTHPSEAAAPFPPASLEVTHELMPNSVIATVTTSRVLYPFGFPNVPHTDVANQITGQGTLVTTRAYADLQGNPLPTPGEDDPGWKLMESFSFAGWVDNLPMPGYRDVDALVERDLAPSGTCGPRGTRQERVDALVERDFAPSPPDEKPGYVDAWLFDSTRNLFQIYRTPPVRYRYVGTLGASGHLTTSAAAKPFENPLLRWPFLQTTHTLFQVDFRQLAAIPLFSVPPSETISAFRRINGRTAPYNLLGLRVVTASHIYFLTASGRLEFSIPVTHDPRTHWIAVIEFPAQHRVVVRYMRPWNEAAKNPIFWDTYDERGTLLSKIDFPNYAQVFPALINPTHSAAYIAGQKQLDAEDGALAAFANPLIFLTAYIGKITLFASPNPWHFPEIKTGLAINPSWPSLLALLTVAAVCALLTWPLARRYRVGRPAAWALLALLTGFPAIMTLIATNTYPRRLPCPTCQKKRPLQTIRCPHCDAPWPAPPATGTEILSAGSLSA